MAVTQTSANKAGFGLTAVKDDAGFYYLPWGAVGIYFGSGTPDHIPVAKASLCIDVENAIIYIATDAAGTWASLGSQS